MPPIASGFPASLHAPMARSWAARTSGCLKSPGTPNLALKSFVPMAIMSTPGRAAMSAIFFMPSGLSIRIWMATSWFIVSNSSAGGHRPRPARRDPVLRLREGLDARRYDAGRAAVQHAPDCAIFALGNSYEWRQPDVDGARADLGGGVERHRAVLEVDPDHVVAGRLGNAGNFPGARAAHAQCQDGT